MELVTCDTSPRWPRPDISGRPRSGCTSPSLRCRSRVPPTGARARRAAVRPYHPPGQPDPGRRVPVPRGDPRSSPRRRQRARRTRLADGAQRTRADRLHRHRGLHPSAAHRPRAQAGTPGRGAGDPRRPAHARHSVDGLRSGAAGPRCPAPTRGRATDIDLRTIDHRVSPARRCRRTTAWPPSPASSMDDLRSEDFVMYAEPRLRGQRGGAAQLPGSRVRATS